jgi:hypothetical protein
MPDEAGEHWFKFKICGDPATLQQRTNEFISRVKESFPNAIIQDSPIARDSWDVEVWISNKKEVETALVNFYLFEPDEVKLVDDKWFPSN